MRFIYALHSRLGDDLDGLVITYDARMAAAAETFGLAVLAPT
jgi:hypothetical protein